MTTAKKPGATKIEVAKKPVSAKSSVGNKTGASKTPASKGTAAKKTAPKVTPGKAPAAKKAVAAKPKAAGTATAAKASKPKPVISPEQRTHYIEVAAFYIAERRGFAPGNPTDDWVAAEAEVDRLIASGKFAQ